MIAWRLRLPTALDTQGFGKRLAGVLRAGDVLVLSGDLGAGKTTFTQGLGAGMGVRGPITSPTFVIARAYPPLSAVGMPLIHVDAYRLAGALELDDLDLDADVDAGVTVVEWGAGLAESLSTDRIEIDLTVDAETEERYAVARLLLPDDQVQVVESVLNTLGGQRC